MTSTSTRAPRRVFAALALLTLLLFVVGFFATSSPGTCALCHAPQARALASTAHRGTGCYACHLPAGGWSILEAKGNELFRMYPARIAGRAAAKSGVRISRDACVSCHEKALAGTTTAAELRVVHAQCAAPPAKCDACHSDVAHPGTVRWARRSDMGGCITCHTSARVSVACMTCHTEQVKATKPKKGTLEVVHGPGWEQTHAMADMHMCGACHEPATCATCHGTALAHPVTFAVTHGKEALRSDATCTSCHRDPVMCDSCHGFPMPHPADFRPQHSRVATSTTDARCVKCHASFDCRNCHTRHSHPKSTAGSLPSSRLPRSRSVP